ncbi:MAG TPA: hypothetical protein VG937_33840 [Polyangiaceae bacterium]|jgi:hypothetical protein|nr:hypothetical protein [Polyangiaceae bacterium]
MKSARSLSNLLIAGAFVAALVSSCTIETKDDDDDETGGKSGATGGTSATTGGSSSETGGSNSTTGGTSATTGGSASTGGSTTTTGGATTNGGASSGAGGEAAGSGGTGGDGGGDGQGGAGGAGGASFDDCESCLDAKCQKELDACLGDPLCFSDAGDGSGQYEQIIVCVDQIRVSRPVKRIDLRTCGTQVGTNDLWPPDGMADTTRNLINCMATGVTNEAENDAWANSSNVNNVWAASSCAKLACTAQLP